MGNDRADPEPHLPPPAAGKASKARAEAAAAVLKGMTAEGQQEVLGDGNEGYTEAVVARSPPPGATTTSQLATWAPKLALKPASLTPWARWKVGLGGGPCPRCWERRLLVALTLTLFLPRHPSPAAPPQSVIVVLLGDDKRKSISRVLAVAGVVMLRTLLQDRIASLNGRSVDLVLRQQLGGPEGRRGRLRSLAQARLLLAQRHHGTIGEQVCARQVRAG